MTKIRIISWNVNGIRAAYKKGAFHWLLQEQSDIFCIQETKAQEAQLTSEFTDIADYHAYFSSAQKKGYSGVALWTREKPITVQRGLGIERFDSEGRTLLADYGSFILFNIYFPNGKQSPERLQYKMDFYDAFLEYAIRLKNAGRKIILCGDVNTAHKEIDLSHPKANEQTSGFLPEERAWIDKLVSSSFLDTFRLFNQQPEQYTWWDVRTRARERNIGWRIDYFFVSENLREQLENAVIFPQVMGSDHCPIGLDLTI